jgi:hypothetical protein
MNPNLANLARETKNEVPAEKALPDAILYADTKNIYAFVNGAQRLLYSHEPEFHPIEFIDALCFHDNALYFSGTFGIKNFLNGDKTDADNDVEHIFSAAGHLWRCGGPGITSIFTDHLSHTLKTGIDAAFGEGNQIWYSTEFEKNKNKLSRFEVFEDHLAGFEDLEFPDNSVDSICSYDSEIYYECGCYKIFKLGSEKPETSLNEQIHALASANGRLYAAAYRYVTDVITGKRVADAEEVIVDICAVPQEWLKRNGLL